MHIGRYGSGADDPRLLPLAWTLRDLVRGYDDTGPILGDASYLTAPRIARRQRRSAISDSRHFHRQPAAPSAADRRPDFFGRRTVLESGVDPDDRPPAAAQLRRRCSYHRGRSGVRVRRCTPPRSGVERLEVRVQLPAGLLSSNRKARVMLTSEELDTLPCEEYFCRMEDPPRLERARR